MFSFGMSSFLDEIIGPMALGNQPGWMPRRSFLTTETTELVCRILTQMFLEHPQRRNDVKLFRSHPQDGSMVINYPSILHLVEFGVFLCWEIGRAHV